jgi:D-3-phosphoglycerate dehydrogenase
MNTTKPTIVITDYTFADLQIEQEILDPAGCDLVGRQCQTERELIALCQDADAVLTQFARVSAAVIGAMRRARVIVRYGIGVDNVDLEAARAQRSCLQRPGLWR